MCHLILPSTAESIAEAVRFCRGQAEWASGEMQDRIGMAVGEAVGNAVEHGNRYRADRNIKLSVIANPKKGITVCVRDEGQGLSRHMLETASLPDDPLQTSGRGLYMIRMLSDSTSLHDQGRRICMVFVPRPATNSAHAEASNPSGEG